MAPLSPHEESLVKNLVKKLSRLYEHQADLLLTLAEGGSFSSREAQKVAHTKYKELDLPFAHDSPEGRRILERALMLEYDERHPSRTPQR
ncbi:hypothetical protein KJ819_01170 [Patescibacteria group bacterium]|nr:hypothetical protein [Patescibacteria group bacterium]MBU1500410.1 hypothetical protein [Patescibacteria group bacterium]MBU2080478.1 hypothetical protein [Patescibacteria group bacterium]MBU2123717.1 hypothetical protein [Patescibacteria group bacterium]MBU2194573.1 hypothetical protein [Patescibacteria group bacterium]